MSSAMPAIRRIGGRLHRPWQRWIPHWDRVAPSSEHRCPDCDGHGIVRRRTDGVTGWQTCPRCGFSDQD